PDSIDVSAATISFITNNRRPSRLIGLFAGQPRILRFFMIQLTDAKDRLRNTRIERMVVESTGPIRATIRCDGGFTGRSPLKFVAGLSLFAGTGLVRLGLTIHNPRAARHRGGLWDLGDPGSVLFRDLSLVLAGGAGERVRQVWSAELE